MATCDEGPLETEVYSPSCHPATISVINYYRHYTTQHSTSLHKPHLYLSSSHSGRSVSVSVCQFANCCGTWQSRLVLQLAVRQCWLSLWLQEVFGSWRSGTAPPAATCGPTAGNSLACCLYFCRCKMFHCNSNALIQFLSWNNNHPADEKALTFL